MAIDGNKSHQGGANNKNSTRKTSGGPGNAEKNHNKKSHKKKKKHKKSTKEKVHNALINSSSPEGEAGELCLKAKGEGLAPSINHQGQLSLPCGSPSSNLQTGSQTHRSNGRSSAPLQNQNLGQVQEQDNKLRASSVGAVCKSSSNISVSSQGSGSGSQTSLPRISSKTSLTVSHEDVLHKSTLRWDMELEDPAAEAERIRIYKINRRKRYIAAQNKKYSDWIASWNEEYVGATFVHDSTNTSTDIPGNKLRNDTLDSSSHTKVESSISSAGAYTNGIKFQS